MERFREARRLEQHQLQPVTHERVGRVSAAAAVEELSIRSRPQGAQQQHERHKEFLLRHGQAKLRVATLEQMKRDRLGRLVGPRAADDGRVLGEARATIAVCRAADRDNMVAPRHDQEADKPLIAVHDKVASALGGFLVAPHKGSRRQFAQVTPFRADHHRHCAEAHLQALHIAVAQPPAQCRMQGTAVREPARAAFTRP